MRNQGGLCVTRADMESAPTTNPMRIDGRLCATRADMESAPTTLSALKHDIPRPAIVIPGLPRDLMGLRIKSAMTRIVVRNDEDSSPQ